MTRTKSDWNHFVTALFSSLELFWGAYASFIAGWLTAAIARHPELDNAISNELVYHMLVRWAGGVGLIGPALLLLIFITLGAAVQQLLQRNGFAHEGDGVELGRKIVRQHLIPLIVSAGSFVVGIEGGKDWASMKKSAFFFVSFLIIAVMFRYSIDKSEPPSIESQNSEPNNH